MLRQSSALEIPAERGGLDKATVVSVSLVPAVKALHQDREVKPAAPSQCPPPSGPLPMPRPPSCPPGLAGGVKGLSAPVPTSTSAVPSLGSPSRDHRCHIRPRAHLGVSHACGAPGASPTPGFPSAVTLSHRATKLPVFLPKTAPARLPRPLLPLFCCSSPEPAPGAAGPGVTLSRPRAGPAPAARARLPPEPPPPCRTRRGGAPLAPPARLSSTATWVSDLLTPPCPRLPRGHLGQWHCWPCPSPPAPCHPSGWC